MAVNVYEPQNLKEEATKNMMIIDTVVEVQAVVQLLVSKGIIANVEMEYMRKQIKDSPKYKSVYEMAQKAIRAAELYEKNPQAYLQELFKAKLNGNLR